jgi:hypothetical protein
MFATVWSGGSRGDRAWEALPFGPSGFFPLSPELVTTTMPTERQKLIAVKLLHTLIWFFFGSCVVFVLYAGIRGFVSPAVWTAVALVCFEGAILILNRWSCPLTTIAQQYTVDRRDNFDIYLPEWLARHNKTIFSTLFLTGLVLLLLRISGLVPAP